MLQPAITQSLLSYALLYGGPVNFHSCLPPAREHQHPRTRLRTHAIGDHPTLIDWAAEAADPGLMPILWCIRACHLCMPNPSSQTYGECYKTFYCQYETTHHCSPAYCVWCFHTSQCPSQFWVSWELHLRHPLPPDQPLDHNHHTKTIYQVQSITGKPLSRKHVCDSIGPLQLRVGQFHEEILYLLVL